MEPTSKITKPLYYYTKVDRFLFENLINSQLYFNSPKNFNDPFDCNAPMIYGVSSSEKIMSDFYDYMLRGKLVPFVLELSKEDFLEQWKNNPALFEQRLRNKIQESIEEEFGILCLTEKNDNIKMWSHYADKHRGVCFEFDTNDFLIPDTYFWKVNYPEDNHYLNFLEENCPLVASLFGQVITKSKIWDYEQEYRVCVPRSGLHRVNKECLTGVIFGVNTPVEEQKTICSLLFFYQYPNVKFYKCERSKMEFKLEIKEMEFKKPVNK